MTTDVRDVKMEARGWRKGPGAKPCRQLRKLKNVKKQVLPRVFRGSRADTSKKGFQTPGLQNSGDYMCGFKPPRLW